MYPKKGLGREKGPFVAIYRRRVFKMSWLWQDMRAMHPKSPANRCWRIHHVNILPGRGTFRCTGPSNHARRANLAKTTSFWIHGGDVLPLRGVISVRGLLENTWRSLIAMVRHCRMHCAPFDSRLARHCSAERRRGRKTLAPRVRPATMTATSAGNRGTVEQRRRCPPEVASLLGGIGAIR